VQAARAAPIVGTALAGLAVVLLAPATADMAAHVFRSELWAREGFTVWNAHWYGGHHVPGYSLLFPPLGAWLGPRLVGALAAVAAVWAFARLTHDTAARALFASAVAANVVIGRMPFTLGIALAVGAWWASERERRAPAALLAAATTAASPVAGIFLVLAGALRRRGELVVPAAAVGIALGLLFPTGGTERFVLRAFAPLFALVVAAAALLRGESRRAALAAAALLLAAFALPTPLGQNAMRLPLLLGPALLVLGAPRSRAVLLVAAALVYLQWLPAVRAVTEAAGDPSTTAAYYDEVRDVVHGERTEVVFTRNHWEAAHLAPHAPLARGWERQLDRRHNALFYADGLTAGRYREWLRENAVRFVALPSTELDYSARAEAALLRRGVPGLREVHTSPRWRIWFVEGSVRDAEILAADTFRAGAGPTAQRWTRYWDGPVHEGPGGRVVLDRDAVVRAR
jgi:hypothetical protein